MKQRSGARPPPPPPLPPNVGSPNNKTFATGRRVVYRSEGWSQGGCEGNFLRDYWREPILRDLEDSMQRFPMPVIVNCAAEEDHAILNRDALPEGTRVASVTFKMIDKSRSEEARGEFVRWALQERCMSVEELLEYPGLIEEGEE
ncbi:unnamed protein product, partial [Prorocentrum cordatum]